MKQKGMKEYLRIYAIVLLFMIGFSAIGAAIMLIFDPAGETLHLPMTFLGKYTFAENPVSGIVLLFIMGILNLFFAVMAILKRTKHSIFFILQGLILFLWSTSEVVFNMEFSFPPMYITLYSASFLLMAIGFDVIKFNDDHYFH